MAADEILQLPACLGVLAVPPQDLPVVERGLSIPTGGGQRTGEQVPGGNTQRLTAERFPGEPLGFLKVPAAELVRTELFSDGRVLRIGQMPLVQLVGDPEVFLLRAMEIPKAGESLLGLRRPSEPPEDRPEPEEGFGELRIGAQGGFEPLSSAVQPLRPKLDAPEQLLDFRRRGDTPRPFEEASGRVEIVQLEKSPALVEEAVIVVGGGPDRFDEVRNRPTAVSSMKEDQAEVMGGAGPAGRTRYLEMRCRLLFSPLEKEDDAAHFFDPSVNDRISRARVSLDGGGGRGGILHLQEALGGRQGGFDPPSIPRGAGRGAAKSFGRRFPVESLTRRASQGQLETDFSGGAGWRPVSLQRILEKERRLLGPPGGEQRVGLREAIVY